MIQSWHKRLIWWLCEKLGHKFITHRWICDGYLHEKCLCCRRTISKRLTVNGVGMKTNRITKITDWSGLLRVESMKPHILRIAEVGAKL